VARLLSWGGGALGVGLLLADLPGCGARGYIDEEALIDVVGAGGGFGANGGTSGGGGTGGGGGSLGGSAGRGGTSSSSSAPMEPFSFVDSMLQRCRLGPTWSAGSSQACNFRFDGRCYDDANAVCACACPRDSNSVCVLSGFLADPNNPLMVSCQATR